MARKLLGIVPNVGDSSNKEAPTSWITTALNLKLDKTGLSASTPLSYNSGTGALSIQAASTTQDGYLSSANFNTFNNKEGAITAGTTSQYWRGDKSWQDLPSAIRSTVLTGLVAGTNRAIAATDSILAAFQNLQAQVNNKLGSTAQATDSAKLGGNLPSYYQVALGYTPLKNTTDTLTGNLTIASGSLYLPATGFSGAGPIQSTVAVKFANATAAQEAYMLKLRLGGTWSILDSNDPGNGGIYASGTINASSFVKSGGTGSQFLKADGSVDTNAYSTTSHNHSGIYAPTSHSHSTLTFSSSGGAAAGTSYDGTVARTIDYSTVGAAAAGHNHSGTYTPQADFKNFGSIAVQAVAGGNQSCTTAQFLTWYQNTYAFKSYAHTIAKCSWSYGGNNDLSDGPTAFNFAGAVIETWCESGVYYTIRITRPTAGAGSYEEWIYNDQGSSYSPGWRRVWNNMTLTNLNQLANGPGYITASTDTLNANSLSALTTIYAPSDSYFAQEDSRATWGCNDFLMQVKSNGFYLRNLQGVDVAYFNLHVPGVNFNCSVTATGNITAYYSDERLKENVRSIDNALNRVKTLSGVYYNSNDLAASYGYTDKNNQVGVLAQQVQKVLPEAIALAPFDDNGSGLSKSGQNFLTVRYDRIIPLLIEAIKEQQKQIEELQNA